MEPAVSAMRRPLRGVNLEVARTTLGRVFPRRLTRRFPRAGWMMRLPSTDSLERRPWPATTTSCRPSATRRWCRLNKLAPAGVNVYVKVESFNPLGSVKDRMARAIIEDAERRGTLQAGPDGDRGDQRQHRHRPGDGVRAEGLSAGRDDGRELQRRAPQAAALSRRARGADAGRREGHGHAEQGHRAGREARLVPVPPVRQRGQRRGAHAHHGAGDPRPTSRASRSTPSCPASAPAARCSARRAA